jgi:hypothetical protein
MVVKTRDKTYVKERGKDKEKLEQRALKLSRRKPNMTIYVVEKNVMV